MSIDKTHLADVTISVCHDMLGIDLSEADSATELDACHFASVNISGNQAAVVQVATCDQAANAISSAMFGTESDQLEESDVADAVCEIANMIGGNVKGILNDDCDLSIPCYSKTPDSKLTEEADSLVFDICGGQIQITSKIEV